MKISRNPIPYGQHKLFDTEVGSLGICVHSNRALSIDVKDPKVEILAAVAMEDDNYLREIEHIEQQSDLEHVEKSSDLRQLRSCWDELSVVTLERGKLIIRGDKEILIPKESRKELIDQLQLTHLSYQGMRNLARNKFFWPGMSSSLEKKYPGCKAGKTNSIYHHDKAHQVIPEGLNLLAPGVQISIDFCLYNNQNILMVKDRVAGLIWGKLTNNQTSDEVFRAVMEWAYHVGIPHECRSDGTGSFRSRFTNMFKEVGIKHVHTSPFNSKSNGGCERGIRSLKDCLKRNKVKKVTHPQDEYGSAAFYWKISQKLSSKLPHQIC